MRCRFSSKGARPSGGRARARNRFAVSFLCMNSAFSRVTVALSIACLPLANAFAALPPEGQVKYRFTRYAGYVVSEGDNAICNSLKPSRCPQGAVARAQQTRPSGGVATGKPDSNKSAAAGVIFAGSLCLVAGMARGENNEKEKDGVPIARADIRYLPQMAGASGAGGLASSMWTVVSAALPKAGIMMRGAVSLATGAFVCTVAYEAGKQIHHIFLRSEDDIQPSRPVRQRGPRPLRGE